MAATDDGGGVRGGLTGGEVGETGGTAASRQPRIVGLAVALPEELDDLLMQSPIALAAFATLPPSQQRSYVEQVTRAGDEKERSRAAADVVDNVLENKQQP